MVPELPEFKCFIQSLHMQKGRLHVCSCILTGMAFAALFGDTLQTKDGEKPTEEVLAGKTAVGIYFSAHWCPPCRGFTPQLAQWYTDTLKDKGMEIVFVSADRTEDAFTEYYAEQPWLSVPYESRAERLALNKKYKVSGIPCLVIVGPDGTTIRTEGRAAVSSDPEGKNYPWFPPTPAETVKDADKARSRSRSRSRSRRSRSWSPSGPWGDRHPSLR